MSANAGGGGGGVAGSLLMSTAVHRSPKKIGDLTLLPPFPNSFREYIFNDDISVSSPFLLVFYYSSLKCPVSLKNLSEKYIDKAIRYTVNDLHMIVLRFNQHQMVSK
jgi:hypothetical protein